MRARHIENLEVAKRSKAVVESVRATSYGTILQRFESSLPFFMGMLWFRRRLKLKRQPSERGSIPLVSTIMGTEVLKEIDQLLM